MIKLDISTSQMVWHKGEEVIIRYISKDGQSITLELEGGRTKEVGVEELLRDNPDLVYEEEYQGEEAWEDDPYGIGSR